MFDEYGLVGGCDHSARLDNFTIGLQSHPSIEGYLVYYGPQKTGELTLSYIEDYLVNSRGILPGTLKRIYAGPNSDPGEPRIQLWLGPTGGMPPEPVKYESKGETFTGFFAEEERWDGVYALVGEGGTGPPVPGVTFDVFAEMLKRRKDAVGYIVAFNGTESAPGAWRRVADKDLKELKSDGLTSDQIKIVYGGTRTKEGAAVQLWIVPKGAPAPIPDAGPETPAKAIQLSDMGTYELTEESVQREALEMFLDALQTSDQLKVCFVVRIDKEETGAESEVLESVPVAFDTSAVADESFEPNVPEPEIDLFQIVEKWKTALLTKHKVPYHRIVVLYATAREGHGSSVETWMVPAGQPLPDPDAERVDEVIESDSAGDEKKEQQPQ